ncbi:MAG: helix-turn-helix domain-containing protein [Christensenellales bacterium]
MAFKKLNTREEIDKRLDGDKELKREYIRAQSEYEIIKRLKKARSEQGLSQEDIAKKSGLTQQMVSRIETADNSPTFRSFIKYLGGLGLEMEFKKTT